MKLIWCLLIAACFAANAFGQTTRPNVLFIAVDDLRPELGCFGSKVVKSPNIDALAARGLQFNRAYCQLALCNPSRASLLTGKRPETIGVFDLATFVRKHDADVVTLPQHFKNHGYRALSFGKIFHATNGNKEDLASWSEKPWKPRGVRRETADAPEKPPANAKAANKDPHADELPYGAPDVADDALADGKIARAAIEAMRENKGKPLFLAVGFHKPHLPFVAPKRYWDLYDAKDIQLPPNPALPKDAPPFASNDASELRRYKDVPKKGPAATDDEARRLIHGYYASVSYVDAQVGKLLAALDEQGLRDSTVIVLWGDHGYHLGEQGTWNKRTNWEIATRVPLIIASPKQNAVGKQTAALVELVDVYPTLAELCSLSLPENLEGTSFVPLMANPDHPWKRAAFSVYQKQVEGMGLATGRAMRTDRYRFIEWSGKGGETVVELYDHLRDPQETTNVANVPENHNLIAELTKQLHEGWKGALRTTGG